MFFHTTSYYRSCISKDNFPEVIVVANAKASKIFKQEYKMDDKMNKSTGFYFKGEIPIFFSGMLSGRRALDIHSRERLIWHIKKSISP